eukprot:jgi/Botrbrau1/17722/Bobra.0166s0144.1
MGGLAAPRPWVLLPPSVTRPAAPGFDSRKSQREFVKIFCPCLIFLKESSLLKMMLS